MGTERRNDDVLGCVLAALGTPFLVLEWLLSLPRRRRRNRLLAGGKIRCPHCLATVYIEGRAVCPACATTSWGSYLSCPNPQCDWQTNAVDCPTCKATIFLETT